MAAQSADFDRNVAHPPHAAIAIFAGLLMAAIFFGAYELIVAGVYMIARQLVRHDPLRNDVPPSRDRP
jgi:hypothetical protein